MTLVAYKSDPVRGAIWHEVFQAEAPELTLVDWTEGAKAAGAPYLAAWVPPADLAKAMPNIRAFFCTGAGTDHLPFQEFPAGLPVIRMVDPAFTQSMAEYVATAVLMLHRDMAFYREEQAAERWNGRMVVPASARHVGIMGLGVMGLASLEAIRPFGFELRGWSASPKSIENASTFVGLDQLDAFLSKTDILVCLLPLTDATRGLLDARTFGKLPSGAMLVNAARGGHLVDADLVAALNTGQVSAAVLDVLGEEPPAPNHALMCHPNVIVTPHIASATHPASAARQVIDGVRSHLRGDPLRHLVGRVQNY